jgi:hypothetical protein
MWGTFVWVSKHVTLEEYRRLSLSDRRFLHKAESNRMERMYGAEQLTPEE